MFALEHEKENRQLLVFTDSPNGPSRWKNSDLYFSLVNIYANLREKIEQIHYES